MVYYKYYLELKNRFILLLSTWITVIITCYWYKEVLIFTIIDSTNYVGFYQSNPYFIFSDVTDVFSVNVQVILFVSNQILLLFMLYHILIFLAPGLYIYELTNISILLKISFFYWIISLFVLNYILLPFSWEFFLSFQEKTNLNSISLFFEANLKEYLNYYINLYYICILNFQIFFLILFSINSFNDTIIKIRSYRRIFYCLLILFATLITPPDVISQLFLSLCFIAIYECITFFQILNKNILIR